MQDSKPVHVMVDTETLGTDPGCVILSIGAIVFDPHAPWDLVNGQEAANRHRFLSLVSLESCLEAGLRVEAGSLRFWLAQEKAAVDEAFAGTTPLRQALSDFTDWLAALCPGTDAPTGACIWAHGATFDPPILAAAYKAVGLEPPWDFRKIRDTRTIFEAAGVHHRGRHHTVITDCLQQAEKVCEAHAVIRGRMRGEG